MRILAEYGDEDLARVFVAQTRKDERRSIVEFAESIQPPQTREQKWVLIVSTLFGCPIGCRMCDAGGEFAGRLTEEEILDQIELLVLQRYPDRKVPCRKFKIQFARMGEPSLNPAVIDAICALPSLYDAPGLIVSLSTIAPVQAGDFFERLLRVKSRSYPSGRFQLQFSIHTTDMERRRDLIPAATWTFAEMADYGERFCRPEDGDRKILLNFAPIIGFPIDASEMSRHFNPEKFIIKLTPLNPTVKGSVPGLRSVIDPTSPDSSNPLVSDFAHAGFEVITSIGQSYENEIGSNCGQLAAKLRTPVRTRES